MKKIISITLVIVLSVLGCTKKTEEKLQATFLEPPLEFRMNKNLHNFPSDEKKQDLLIEATLANGWGGFALNSPFRQYLTPKGLQSTLRFCDKAKAKGMELWLYDENGYPSGSAGDLVISENPKWEAMGIFMKDTLISDGLVNFSTPKGEPIIIKAFPIKEGRMDYNHPVDLLEFFSDHTIKWKAPVGDWKIFAATKYRLYEGFQAGDKTGGKLGSHYPSLLISEATDAFINITHEAYAKTMGYDLGKYFTSTFTDEPSLMALQFHSYKTRDAVIPWKELLSEEIKKRYGYKPEDQLIELFYDEGAEGQKIRYQYFHTVADLISTNYFGKIKNWCGEHHFQSGGHLLLEESMIAHVPLYGDIMKCFREMDAPGIDILSCLPENTPVYTPKLVSSIKELSNGNNVMSEPCPVADRSLFNGLNPKTSQVRGHLNRLMQGGITDFNCYLKMNNSTQEERIAMNKYVGRIELLLQAGHIASEIGVLYPIQSMWTEYMPRWHKVSGWKNVTGAREEVNKIDKAFQDVSYSLFENCWEYTILDSKAIIDSKLKGEKLVHNQLKFKVLILPYVTTLPEVAWKKLVGFIKQGGKIIALERMPENTENVFPDMEIQQTFMDFFNEKLNVVFMSEWDSEKLNNQLNIWLAKPVCFENENLPLRLTHRKTNGKDVIFIINDSDKEINTNLTFSLKGTFKEWDPESGMVNKVGNRCSLYLKPYHGKIYRTY